MARLKGIDVSQWQGNINYKKVKEDGIELVYIKSSEGSDFIDPYFEKNYEGARKEKIKIGFYHYLIARNVSQAKQEAYHFVKTISDKQFEGKPVMDFENLTGLSRGEVNLISFTFLKAVESYIGERPAIYSDVFNASNMLDKDLAVYPLWIAEYDTSHPSLNNPWNTWTGWQYTDEGNVSGISGRVDKNKFKEEMLRKESQSVKKPLEHPKEEESVRKYIVKEGDTLTGIAQLYNVSIESILKENKIKDPNLIYVGEELKIRISGKISHKDTYILYHVIQGDTLSEIANRYNITLKKLKKLNKIIEPDFIYSGQIIKIPKVR